MKLYETRNYRSIITVDGTDSGTQVGYMNATVDGSSESAQQLNINLMVNQPDSITDPAIISSQITSFISAMRGNANIMGMTAFAEGSAQ